jgi:hypothetical protein
MLASPYSPSFSIQFWICLTSSFYAMTMRRRIPSVVGLRVFAIESKFLLLTVVHELSYLVRPKGKSGPSKEAKPPFPR